MQTFVGKIISNKMQKSVLVAVSRWATVPKYKLRVVRTKKFMAHDERNECNPGDLVRINSSRPISKRKAWVVTDILRRQRVLGGQAAAETQSRRMGDTGGGQGFAASAS